MHIQGRRAVGFATGVFHTQASLLYTHASLIFKACHRGGWAQGGQSEEQLGDTHLRTHGRPSRAGRG